MATVARENIGLLNDKLTVTLNKADYYPAFEKSLKNHSKNANIPGFRKGMVPAGMIRKMHGQSIFNDEVLRAVEKELTNWLQNERPEIFAQPLPLSDNLGRTDLNNPADIEFAFEIGLKPDYTMADLSAAALTLHKVDVTEAMIDEEVKRMLDKAGKMTEPETISNPEDVLNVVFREIDATGHEVESTGPDHIIHVEDSLLLKYFTSPVQEKLLGKQKGDSIGIQLEGSLEKEAQDALVQDLGYDKDDAAPLQKHYKVTIDKIGFVEKRALDEAFFNEVFPGKAIATEAEFREELKKEIEQYWNSQSRVQLQDQIYHYLLEKTDMEFPTDFLKRWLLNGSEKAKTPAEVEAEYPGFSNSLKWTLISDKLIQENNLHVLPEELKGYMKNEVLRYFG